MKILIIDNGSRFLPQLLKKLSSVDTVVIKRSFLGKRKLPDSDAMILSGGHAHSIVNHRKFYKSEIALVKKYKKPILGICLGFEIIAVAFDGKLLKLDKKERGEIKINVLKKDEILKTIPKLFNAYEAHKWALVDEPRQLIDIAQSVDGIEILRHRTRPIYGLQFHPEATNSKGVGYKILANFLRQFA
jgi:GMP synthase (glutamine-hydrolysing)